ncbi:protein kinase C-like 1 [Monosporozyma servazzii]
MLLPQVEQDIHRKIAVEQNIIQGATNMKKKTDNTMVIQRCNTSIREARQNIQYLQETLNKLRLNSNSDKPEEVKEDEAIDNQKRAQSYGYLSTVSPNEHVFSRLDLIKYDCPSLAQRIQFMLQQLQFKLQVERQYQEANTKLTKLYQIDGDQRSSSAAEGGAFESKHRILMLKKALKKYQAINVDLDQYKHHDAEDLNISQPKFRRKPLSGTLNIRVSAIRDVDHIQSPMFARSPESFITIKIDDTVKARSKPARNDRWQEDFQILINKGNEAEITVYDKVNDAMTPVAIIWLQLADIAEEIRKKKANQTNGQQGWVKAANVTPSNLTDPSESKSGDDMRIASTASAASAVTATSGVNTPPGSININQWFIMEPAGQINLSLGFNKTTSQTRKNVAGGLHRHGAIINRSEEIFEQHGHHFVQKSFYNIMSCAYCGEFLRYTGFQCQDCKFLCHKKCYTNVVTKCIAKTSNDDDSDETKLSHNIPHRFEPSSNRGTKWCCHCGYILPWGKQKVRKCTECGIMCHTDCAHLVPDFCGMSMEMANKILRTIQDAQRDQEKRKRLPLSSQTAVSRGTSQERIRNTMRMSQATIERPKSETSSLSMINDNDKDFNKIVMTRSPDRSPNKRKPAEARVQDFIQNNETYLDFTTNAGKVESPLDTTLRSLDPSLAKHEPSIIVPFHNDHDSAGHERTNAEDEAYREENELWEEKRHEMELEIERQRQEHIKEHARNEDKLELETTLPINDYNAAADTSSATIKSNPFREMNNETFQQQQAATPIVSQESRKEQSTTDTEIDHVTMHKANSVTKHKKKAAKRRKVSLDNFMLLKVLGKGNFGKVILSKSKNTNRICAIKVLKKDSILQNHDIESARAEKKVFLLATKTKHPFLTNLYCSFQTENRIYFAMEFIGGGDLMWHVQNQRLSVRRAKFYAAEVLLALKYFHDNGVIYRDLKLENILLTPQGHIKIADYGLCKDEMWYGNKTSTFCGTPEFMAPEILKDQEYTRAVDWWAFGVLLYQMLLCQSPFSGDDEDEVFNAILTDEPLYPIDMAGDIVQIFQGLLAKDPEHRLGAGTRDALEVMEEPFFHNINFDDILNLRVEPPYIPEIKSEEDTSYFEQEFTSAPPTLTPIPSVLTTSQQEEFRGFSFMPEDLEL